MDVCRCLCLWKIKWKENVENIFVEKPRKWEFFYTLALLSCVCSLHVKLSNPYDWELIAEVLLFENIIVNKFPSNSRNLKDRLHYHWELYLQVKKIIFSTSIYNTFRLKPLLLLHINCNIPDERNFYSLKNSPKFHLIFYKEDYE